MYIIYIPSPPLSPPSLPPSMYYKIPELVMDVIFLTWIYLALGSTIRILTEFQQGYKLNLYKRLENVITIFVTLFVIASLLLIADKRGWITWPWQWTWAQEVRAAVRYSTVPYRRVE